MTVVADLQSEEMRQLEYLRSRPSPETQESMAKLCKTEVESAKACAGLMWHLSLDGLCSRHDVTSVGVAAYRCRCAMHGIQV